MTEQEQRDQHQHDIALIRSTINEQYASIAQMQAQTAKTMQEGRWYPLILMTGAMGAGAALLAAGAALARLFA